MLVFKNKKWGIKLLGRRVKGERPFGTKPRTERFTTKIPTRPSALKEIPIAEQNKIQHHITNNYLFSDVKKH